MKLVTYRKEEKSFPGILINDVIYDLNLSADRNGIRFNYSTIRQMLEDGESAMEAAGKVLSKILNDSDSGIKANASYEDLLAPVPNPASCRDGYAFRQHVEAARKNRNVPMISEFDEYPIFYFTNHQAIQGPGIVEVMPDHLEQLDFELEAAIVIGKKGKNIKAEEADNFIAGYMIMNDFSARLLQMEEMKLNLGPAKGKDFSTVIGPWLVTPDELEKFKVNPKQNHTGSNYNLTMKCLVNGELKSEGNMADMDWTFAEIIERCAYGVNIFPGDVIGSGTVGTGCFLELNGTGKRLNPDYKPQWLQHGDTVEMEITGLGKLINTIKKADSSFSILKRKKKPADVISN